METLGKLIPLKLRMTPEWKANLIQKKTDLEIRRWELSEELETVQSMIESIDAELGYGDR